MTEYCAGGSLLDVLSHTRRPLGEAQLAATLGAALGALAYLHDECQILHRDIKSANLLLTSEGEVCCDGHVSSSKKKSCSGASSRHIGSSLTSEGETRCIL